LATKCPRFRLNAHSSKNECPAEVHIFQRTSMVKI
jgi:hypothetical protein